MQKKTTTGSQHYNAAISNAEKESQEKVTKYFSEQPYYVNLGGHTVFRIPVNYYSPWGKSEKAAVFDPKGKIPVSNQLNFKMFLPDYRGYGQNYVEYRDNKQFIKVYYIRVVDPTDFAQLPATVNSARERLKAQANDVNYDIKPSRFEYQLSCHKNGVLKGGHDDLCLGTRSNGEELLIEVSELTEKDKVVFADTCRVKYYTKALGGVMVFYDFPRNQLANWKQIDDALWAKLDSWQINH